jgi:hypothetical protein
MTEPLAPDSDAQFLAALKRRIQTAQLHASLAVNQELVLLYWQIGRDILDRQERESWGAKVIDRLAADLKRAFPDMKGSGYPFHSANPKGLWSVLNSEKPITPSSWENVGPPTLTPEQFRGDAGV